MLFLMACHDVSTRIRVTLNFNQGAYNRAAQRLTFLRSTCDAGSSLGRVIFFDKFN